MDRFTVGDKVEVAVLTNTGEAIWHPATVLPPEPEATGEGKLRVAFDNIFGAPVLDPDAFSSDQLPFPRVAYDVELDEVRRRVPLPEMQSTAGPSIPPSQIENYPAFGVGMTVEVESYERGYVGSWYTAKILRLVKKDRYLVEYDTLTTENPSELFKELVNSYRIRPCPPIPGNVAGYRYRLLDEVDARFNDGWWIGQICGVPSTKEYSVYFWTSNEMIKLRDRHLRPHQEWIGGNWTSIPKKKFSLTKNAKLGRVNAQRGLPSSRTRFTTGQTVEVRSDVLGFQDSWYPASILDHGNNGRYYLECLSLITEDGRKLLKVSADGECMRPCPPFLELRGRFKLNEPVEAWIREGWCKGVIKKVNEDASYLVFIESTKETAEFQFLRLRPHQEWISGQWISYTEGKILGIEEA